MNQKINPLNSKAASSSGVLYLSPPPEPWKAAEWYASPIAAVPLLLRNILTLQRAGLQDLTLYINTEEIEKLTSLIEKDARITAKIDWISKPGQLKEALQNQQNQVLLFNGSALHDKKQVRSLLQDSAQEESKKPEALSISNDQLELFLEKIRANEKTALASISNLNHENEESHTSSFIYLPGGEETQIHQPEDFKAQHERLLKGSGQNHDSPITRLLSRPFSQLMTRFFLNTPISPNQITLLSFAMGMMSAFCFAQGTYPTNVVGGILLLWSTWVDGADGEIARLKFMETELGGKLDIICDNIVHFFVFGAIGWGVSEATGDKTYLYLGALAAFASLTSFALLGEIILKKNTGATAPLTDSEPSVAEKLANRDFIHFLMLMAVFDFVHIFVFISAIGATVFTAYLVYLRFSNK